MNRHEPGLTKVHEKQLIRIWSATTPVVADVTEAKSGDFALRKVIADRGVFE